MVPELSKVVTQGEGATLTKSCHVTLRSRGYVTNKKRYVSTFTRTMDPNLARW